MRQIKLGFLGPQGTHSQSAALRYNEWHQQDPNQSRIITVERSFYDMFDRLAADALDEMIVPIENSVEGPVTIPFDLMIEHPEFQINTEIVIPIQNMLLAKKETYKEDITRIVSHEQPLAQCHRTIRRHFPQADLIPCSSTAEAVSRLITAPNPVIPHPKQTAVIATKNLYEKHPDTLSILMESVNDYANNQTRFWVISKKHYPYYSNPAQLEKTYKTSLVFTLEKDRTGGLYTVLEAFRNINLTQISSRPSKSALGEYLFWIDLEGHQEQAHVATAIAATRHYSGSLRCLGSYLVNPSHLKERSC